MEPRQHRHFNYWDAIYDPLVDLSRFKQIELSDFTNNTGPQYGLFDLEKLNKEITNINNINFKCCDIFGSSHGARINFKECSFIKVFFGYAIFSNVKFQSCLFENSSFSMAQFDNCQFINCTFKNISFAGNETVFRNTIINSHDLIQSGYTNLDENVLAQNSTSKEYQKSRFEKTKAKVSKMLVSSLASTTDDDLYYNALKTYLICRSNARIEDFRLESKSSSNGTLQSYFCGFKAKVAIIELGIIKASGFINNWGNGLFRAICFGLFFIIAFGLYYHWVYGASLVGGFIKSIDITFLAGYTKHVTKETPTFQQIIMLFNMCIGLWWYAIMIPTLINRICNIRQ